MEDVRAVHSAGLIAMESLTEAEKGFEAAHPCYAATRMLDDLRASEFGRLDETGQIYLDYTGAGLYAESQLREHMDILRHHVFGNPHSNNPTSLAMTRLVERCRASVLQFFNASPADYVAIFTGNASGALKLVGESYPFGPGDHYLLTFDNHNSVNGIREFARARGAAFSYLPVVRPELRIEPDMLIRCLDQAKPGSNSLFAFPAQSNFSGVQHPLEIIGEARARGWDVLVDAAAFAPSNSFDLSLWKPDFVPLSFYKMFGYPTGVGCLLARRQALAKLVRPWYAGGTITISSVQGDGHYLAEGEAGFEDGTLNFLSLPAVEVGLRLLSTIGMPRLHERVMCLAGWLLDSLVALRHTDGRPLVQIHGPQSVKQRGATVTMTFYDSRGHAVDDQRVEELANSEGISLRTGCFCNPGAGEVAHGLIPEMMHEFFKGQEIVTFQYMRKQMRVCYGKEVSAVRVSVGLATNFADVYRFVRFARGLLDHTVDEIGPVESESRKVTLVRDSA